METYLNQILHDTTYKIVLSNAKDKTFPYYKIVIEIKDNKYIASKYTDKQVFHDNAISLMDYLLTYIEHYKQVNSFDEQYEYCLKVSKKNKIMIGKSKNQAAKKTLEHNRKKHYILKEGMLIPPLVDMGIFTKEGKVIASMYDKFKQINKFLEIIDDQLKQKEYKKLTIVDFGCGKSYLTFVLYYFLTKVKQIDVSMVGLDLKEDVIVHCNEVAKRYGYHNLRFEIGDIHGYKVDYEVDMVITLHACDIATDYALFNAIIWNAKMIFSVPCCQHELNSQIHCEEFSILTRYGIAKERLSAIYTDVIRCNLLQSMGYKTQLLEFIDLQHTAKNLLIRAGKTHIPASIKHQMLKEVEALMEKFHLQPKLYALLKSHKLFP